MSLDVRVLREIDYKVSVRKPVDVVCPELDVAVLDMINRVPLAHSQPYLRAAYIKYYFRAKADYIKEHNEERK